MFIAYSDATSSLWYDTLQVDQVLGGSGLPDLPTEPGVQVLSCEVMGKKEKALPLNGKKRTIHVE